MDSATTTVTPPEPAAPEPREPKRQVARDLVISLLALVSVTIGLYQYDQGADATGGLHFGWLDGLDLAIVVVFWIDFVVESRRVGFRVYARSHWIELPSLVPGIALFRALRLLRLLRVVSVVMRLRPAGSYSVRLARRARIDLIFGIAAVVVFVGALGAWMLESEANPSLRTFGKALWFSFNMCTNVAYLDFQPATTGGRILAGLLQLFGIAFIGIFTASLAGAIIKEPPPPKDDSL